MQGQHFVLVHGAQHGAWCWYKMKNLLEKAGHRVTAVDLMSAGISAVSADHVESFDQYNQPLYDLLESLSLSEKVSYYLRTHTICFLDHSVIWTRNLISLLSTFQLMHDTKRTTMYISTAIEHRNTKHKRLKPSENEVTIAFR